MEQQEKQVILSQRLRRAVTCMKRKEREGGEGKEEDSEEEMPSPSKSKRENSACKSLKRGGEVEGERTAAGGGFLGTKVIFEPCHSPLKDGSSTSQGTLSVKVPQSTTVPPQKARKSSSSSSGEDSDSGDKVAMVTAQSVFEASRRGKSTRVRGSTRGKGRGKKSATNFKKKVKS